MKVETKVIKYNGTWAVKFSIGIQSFTLDTVGGNTKAEALWMKKQLNHAFKNLKSK